MHHPSSTSLGLDIRGRGPVEDIHQKFALPVVLPNNTLRLPNTSVFTLLMPVKNILHSDSDLLEGWLEPYICPPPSKIPGCIYPTCTYVTVIYV